MKLICKKCCYDMKVSIFKDLPKEIVCVSCGNKIKLNNILIKINEIINLCICVLLSVFFRYCLRYMFKIIQIENIFFRIVVGLILSLCIFCIIYIVLFSLICKIFLCFYKEWSNTRSRYIGLMFSKNLIKYEIESSYVHSILKILLCVNYIFNIKNLKFRYYYR